MVNTFFWSLFWNQHTKPHTGSCGPKCLATKKFISIALLLQMCCQPSNLLSWLFLCRGPNSLYITAQITDNKPAICFWCLRIFYSVILLWFLQSNCLKCLCYPLYKFTILTQVPKLVCISSPQDLFDALFLNNIATLWILEVHHS